MYGIDLLVEEHKNIIKFTEIMKNKCAEIMNGAEVDTNLFREYIDFARNYADKHHHGKEELILFKVMTDKLGMVAEKLVKHGMLIEHDFGRLFMANLEEALDKYDEEKSDDVKLDIIANAVGYGHLLRRHIEKEDSVVYTYAHRELDSSDLEKVDSDTVEFEKENVKQKEKYEKWLNEQIKNLSN